MDWFGTCCRWSIIGFILIVLSACEIDAPTVLDVIHDEPIVDVVDYTDVPELCLPYRELLEEVADCPARRAAMMEQESSCKKFALSFDDGKGLFQFTGDDIGPWLESGICRDLGPFDPFDPDYAIKCGTRYAKHLTGSYDQHGIRVGEMRFNGGYWVVWEIQEAVLNGLEPTLENGRKFCGTLLSNGRKRAEKWCDWNYQYYVHIERRLLKYYSYLVGECEINS